MIPFSLCTVPFKFVMYMYFTTLCAAPVIRKERYNIFIITRKYIKNKIQIYVQKFIRMYKIKIF